MLKQWRIQQFKAIADSGQVQLAPITVVAGQNSSGKTSFLQSILMIAQTIGSRLDDRPLLPTERLVQLGTVRDIVRSTEQEHSLAFAFEIDVAEDPESFTDEEGETYWEAKPPRTNAQIEIVFQPLPQTENVASPIDATSLKIDHVHLKILPRIGISTKKQHYSFSYHPISESETNELLQGVTQKSLRLLPYPPAAGNYIGSFDPPFQKGDPVLYFLTLAHFFPASLVARAGNEQGFQEEMRESLFYLFGTTTLDHEFAHPFQTIDPADTFSEELKTQLDQFIETEHLSPPLSTSSLQGLAAWVANQQASLESDAARQLTKNIRDLVLRHQENPQPRKVDRLTRETIDYRERSLLQTLETINFFFTNNIRYLGPLRADPGTTLLQFSPSGKIDDVGAKGEYAAFVYHTNRFTRVDFFNPNTQQREQEALHIALDVWAKYLGIAETVQTDFAGMAGITWKIIQASGQQPRYLPQVGVGVSQVLPLLVMGLLAPTETLLIVEQPELHLHPRLQARLGDFFFGLMQCEKRCLIETHSEYLVNQLRYYIVRSGGKKKDEIAIYFVALNAQGAADFIPIDISAQGNILNWPEGFFDESYVQQDRIHEEILKRKGKQHDGESPF